MESLFNFGIDLIVAFQSAGDWMLTPMEFFTFLGSEDFFILILPVLYWSVDAALGLRVGVILLLTSGINNLLKFAFHWPRPYWYSAKVTPFSAEASFGMPSGHSQSAVGVWGAVASYYRRSGAWIAAISLMLLVGLSRIYLGVHFPHDVLTGWLVGVLILWVFLRYWDDVAEWAQKMTLGKQILTAFLVSMGLTLTGVLLTSGLRDWTMPVEWMQNAARAGNELPAPVSMSGLLTTTGTLFGLLAGLAFMETKGGFSAAGLPWKRLVRYLIGLVGVAIIYVGLKLVFPEGSTFIPSFFRYLRYMLLGFWISGLAPWLFVRLQLANNVHE